LIADHSRSARRLTCRAIRAAASLNTYPSRRTFCVWVVIRTEDWEEAHAVDTFVSRRAFLIITGRIAMAVA